MQVSILDKNDDTDRSPKYLLMGRADLGFDIKIKAGDGFVNVFGADGIKMEFPLLTFQL
jgi:hypothetical protein